GPQMKSVGEVMAIGRTFKEALLKGVRSLETGRRVGAEKFDPRILTHRLVTPHPERLPYLRYALRTGMSVKQLARMTSIDPWFLHQMKEINDEQAELEKTQFADLTAEQLREAKRFGLSDERLAQTFSVGEGRGGAEQLHQLRKRHGVTPVYKRVDTCAGEFESFTPYLYST